MKYLLVIFGLLFFISACTKNETKNSLAENRASSIEQSGLKLVQKENVCMVNDALFPNKQIPIHVGEKLYYGCCQNCVKTLNEDESSRYGVDPVTKEKVDKSSAVIAAKQDGSVLYFESVENFNAFASAQKN